MFAGDGGGRRQSAFSINGLRISVTPSDDEDNERAFEYACELSRHDASIADLCATVQDQANEIVSLKLKLPGRRKVRLLGRGFVRFDDWGTLWLLNRQDRGFGEWGISFEDWDVLFRRYDVRVVEHGSDAHGMWWAVENFERKADR